jgi:hypothetical protein
LCAECVGLGQKPKHEVFGTDLIVVGCVGFILCCHHDVPGLLGEPAESLVGIKV